MKTRRWWSCAIWVALGVAIGWAFKAPSLPMLGAQLPGAQPQEDRLLANLYMVTSGEYRACCLEIYRFAEERLAQKLLAHRSSGKAPAVVMDLDETVFDNSGFQTVLYRDRLVYHDELWVPWERDFPQEVRLVPGAKAFIEHAEAAGVAIVYITNRSTRFRDSTIAALKNNHINVAGIEQRLLLKEGKDSDKTERRARAASQYDVLLWCGDSLRDFSETFKVHDGVTVDSRKKLVDDAAAHWGNDWFMLPNCSYGEWEKLLKPAPAAHLPPTAMPNPQNGR